MKTIYKRKNNMVPFLLVKPGGKTSEKKPWTKITKQEETLMRKHNRAISSGIRSEQAASGLTCHIQITSKSSPRHTLFAQTPELEICLAIDDIADDKQHYTDDKTGISDEDNSKEHTHIEKCRNAGKRSWQATTPLTHTYAIQTKQ